MPEDGQLEGFSFAASQRKAKNQKISAHAASLR